MTTCSIHHDTEAVGSCASCGAAVCAQCVGDIQGAVLTCRKCLEAEAAPGKDMDKAPEAGIAEAAPVIVESVQIETTTSAYGSTFMWVLFGFALLVFGWQKLFIVDTPEAPDAFYTSGEEQTRAMACYTNLATIVALLEENRLEEIQQMRCPLHDQPYIIQQINGDIVVIDPEPTAMGFRDIRIARSIGIPELTPLEE